MLLFFVYKLVTKTINELKKKDARDEYGTLYEGIELSQPPSKYYYLLILARGILLVVLIVFLESVPVLQVVPLIIFNMGLISPGDTDRSL